MIKEGKWNLDKDVDRIWNEMTNCTKRVAKDVLGESKGCGQSKNQEVQATIRLRDKAIEAYLDVETMLLMIIIKWQRRD